MCAWADKVPEDWYVDAFDAKSAEMAWTDRTAAEVDRVERILEPRGAERVLDLACGSGRHALGLGERGYEVVGADISPELIEIAWGEAAAADLDVEFVRTDLRDLSYEEEFDLVLSLNGGAIGYLESDGENWRTFDVISCALRPGGRSLLQIPNVLYARERLPERSWIPGGWLVELLEQRWNEDARRLEGTIVMAHLGEVIDNLDGIRFSKRLYGIDELREIYATVDMELLNVYDHRGRPAAPRPNQPEIFVEAWKR